MMPKTSMLNHASLLLTREENIINMKLLRQRKIKLIISFLMIYALLQTEVIPAREVGIGDVIEISEKSREKTTQASSNIGDTTYAVPVNAGISRISDDIILSQMEIQQQIMEEERQRIQAEQEAIIQAEAARIAQINSITADSDDITKVSNMTEEQFAIATEGTWLEGREQVFIDLERRYGINAFFAMSVTTLESGHGESSYSRAYNRFYGEDTSLTPSEGLYDSTMYFGDFINRLYVDEGLISVWAIGPKYCPPNRNWEVFMNNKMNELKNKVVQTVK